MKIRMVIKNNGITIADSYVNEGVTLEDVMSAAEGISKHVDYVMVEVDGAVYAEYEA